MKHFITIIGFKFTDYEKATVLDDSDIIQADSFDRLMERVTEYAEYWNDELNLAGESADYYDIKVVSEDTGITPTVDITIVYDPEVGIETIMRNRRIK